MKMPKSFVIMLLVMTVLSWFVGDYLMLPAYNLQSFGFWIYTGFGAAWFLSLLGMLLGMRKWPLFGLGIGGGIIFVAMLASIGSWTLWPGNDARYFRQMEVADRPGEAFVKDFPGTGESRGSENFLMLPVIDKELSTTIAQGKLGQYGAQFQMDTEIFTAISVNRGGHRAMVRVSPLDYSGSMVALSAGGKGTAGYIEVDQLTEEARLVEVTGGMKYTPGAMFSRDLTRRLRFAYRTALFGPYSFEIDDDGKPFWVVPVLRNTIGLFGGAEQKGLVLVDPVSGDLKYFERGSEPAWVDRSVPTYLAMEQANNYLGLKNGWGNRAFGEKREVFQLSDGYNYVFSNNASGSATWFISGITSPNESDQTLVGFLMINMKTKEARRYSLGGITEMRAMEIAQNDERVRAQTLAPTWPILVEVDGQAAYFLFLKNSVQRQRFVYLDVATGQKVAMGDTLEGAASQFALLTGGSPQAGVPALRAAGTVFRVRQNAAQGTIQFILDSDRSVMYTVASELSNGVRFLAPRDRVEVSYRASQSNPSERFVTELRNLSIEAGAANE